MAIDLKLDDDYDLAFENGDLVTVSGAEEVAQSSNIRILFIKGEWYFNVLNGVPWWEDMFTVETSYEQKEKILKDTIRGTQGINQILSFTFGIDPVDRLAEVEYEADTVFGPVSLKVGG